MVKANWRRCQKSGSLTLCCEVSAAVSIAFAPGPAENPHTKRGVHLHLVLWATWQRALAWGIRNRPYSVVEVFHAILSIHPGADGGRRHRLRAFPARAGARSARPATAGRRPCPSPGRSAGTAAAPQGTGRATCKHLLRVRQRSAVPGCAQRPAIV